MTATAAAFLAPSGPAPVQSGPARRACAGQSFDEAMLALLLGGAESPPAAWVAPGEVAPAPTVSGDAAAIEPDAIGAPCEEPLAATTEGVATAEAFPLAELAAQWLALREPAALAVRAGGDSLLETGEESGGPDRTAAIAGKAARRFHADPFATPKAGAPEDAASADAEFAVPLPAVVVESARQDTRKSEFTPSLIAAAQEMRAPPRPEPVAPRPADVPTLAAEPGTAAFREGFAERVTILTRGGLTEAEITLHPADLGPIDVRIRIEDGAATFRFDTPLAETRRAIEESLPRLAEMLEGNGLSLGDTQVGHPGHDGSEPAPFAGRAGAGLEDADADDEPPPLPPRRVTIAAPGRVDLFA